MSSLWDSVYSIFTRTRNYLVDPPSEENPENPELAITEERRGATTFTAGECPRPLTSTKLYCLVTGAHICEQIAQCRYAALSQWE